MTTTIEQLTLIANNHDLTSDTNIDNPNWEEPEQGLDWCKHVPETIRNLWGQLSHEARLVAFIQATDTAIHEIWRS